MQDRWKFKDFVNIGKYKESFLEEKSAHIDIKNYFGMQTHINNITDTLFLNLSRGIKAPAIFSAEIVYDYTDGTFAIEKGASTDNLFLTGVSHTMSGGVTLDYIDATVNPELISLSDITPLFFIFNTSKTNTYAYDYQPFPRIDEIIRDSSDWICRIFIESPIKSSWSKISLTQAEDSDGLAFTLEGLFQSRTDNTDTTTYTAGIPYMENISVKGHTWDIETHGWIYANIEPDGSHTLWPTKLKTRVMEWNSDFSVFVGDYTYSFWEDNYHTGMHISVVGNLQHETDYSVWYQIDSQVGPDALDFTGIGIYTTDPF